MIDYSYLLNRRMFLQNPSSNIFNTTTTTDSPSVFSESFFNAQESIFNSLNTNSDRNISDEELLSLREKSTQEDEFIRQDLNTIFKELDGDMNGEISDLEFENMQGAEGNKLEGNLLKKLMVMMGLEVENKSAIETELEKIEAELNRIKNPAPLSPNSTQETPDLDSSHRSSFSGDRRTSSDRNGNTEKPKTADEYNKEISGKEAEKNELEKNAEKDIKAEEDNIQKAMEDASSGLTASQVQEYNNEKNRINGQIKEQDGIIKTTTSSLSENQAKLATIPATISAFDEQISNLKASMTTGTTKDDKDKNQRINTKIKNLTTEKKAKEKEKENLEKQIKTDSQALETAKGKKSELETEQNGLLDKFLEDNKDKIPMEIQTSIRKSQTKIQSIKSEKETKTNSLNNEIQTLRNGLEELKAKNNTNEIIDKNKESSFDANGNRIGTRKMPSTPEEYAKYGLETAREIDRFERCHQASKEAIIDLLDYAMEQGMTVRIGASLRTYEEQVALYRGGENKMAAKPGTSMHESGQAFDISIEGANRRNPNDPKFKKLGEIWANKGYRWGGYWKNQCEPWHFDTKGSF